MRAAREEPEIGRYPRVHVEASEEEAAQRPPQEGEPRPEAQRRALNLVDRVRTSCARVVDRATLVHIDFDALASYDPGALPASTETSDQADTAVLADASLADAPLADAPAEIEEPSALLVLALDAINFGSGYHDVVRKRPGCSGAVTMAQSLTDHALITGPLTPRRLATITPRDCSRIFDQELDGGLREELMVAFSVGLNDLGAFIDDHGGSARSVLDTAAGSAVSLAELLTEMPYYRDLATLDGEEVCFYKRAQITAADIGRRWNVFSDLRRLTAFADNLVPHVLRIDGILRYHPDLTASIDRGEQLEAGSRAEIEIRAAAVHAVELLADRTGARAMDLDALLWHRGAQARYKAIPRHRSRSVYY